MLPTGVRSEPGMDHGAVGRTNAHFIAKNYINFKKHRICLHKTSNIYYRQSYIFTYACYMGADIMTMIPIRVPSIHRSYVATYVKIGLSKKIRCNSQEHRTPEISLWKQYWNYCLDETKNGAENDTFGCGSHNKSKGWIMINSRQRRPIGPCKERNKRQLVINLIHTVISKEWGIQSY